MGSVLSVLREHVGDAVSSPVFDGTLDTVLAVQLALMVGWTIPSTYTLKRQYLRFLAHSRFIKAISKYIPFGMAVLLYVLVREWSQRVPPTANAAVRRAHRGVIRRVKAAYSFALLMFLSRAYYLLYDNEQAMFMLDVSALDRDILNFRPPALKQIEFFTSMYRSVCDPVFIGMDNIPTERPLLFVSNHTIMGFEFPLMLYELYARKGIFVRALADHSHFQIPINGQVLRNVMGAVDGNQHSADLLMRAGECLWVYPGGARETFKRTSDPKYALFWKNHLGFVKLAVRHGATIVPVINLGTEDMAEIVYDLPIGWLPIPFLFGSDRTVPIIKPPKLSKLQRVYFAIGQPIETKQYIGQQDNQDVLTTVRDQAQREILDGIEFLKHVRAGDSGRYAQDRIPAVRTLVNWLKKKAVEQRTMNAAKM